jgi:hypothetical protein
VRQKAVGRGHRLNSDRQFEETAEISVTFDLQVTHRDEEGLELLCYVHRLTVADLMQGQPRVSFDSEVPGKTHQDWWCKRCLKRAFALPIHLHVDTHNGQCHLELEEKELKERFAQFPRVLNLIKWSVPIFFNHQFVVGDTPIKEGSSFKRDSLSLIESPYQTYYQTSYQITQCDNNRVTATYRERAFLEGKDRGSVAEGTLHWNCANGLLFEMEDRFFVSQEHDQLVNPGKYPHPDGWLRKAPHTGPVAFVAWKITSERLPSSGEDKR